MSLTSSTQTVDRYGERFAAFHAAGQKMFIPFTLLGWPDNDTAFTAVKTMIDAGAGALELGMPFSDPAADGPIIQRAALDAIGAGFRVDDGIALLKRIRAYDAAIPIGLLVYYNTVLARGIETFFSELGAIGVDAVLIADLPPEAAEEVAPAAAAAGVRLIFIVSPLTSSARVEILKRHAGGFLYVVSRLGITGTEERYDATLQTLLARLKTETSLPCCVGFGISTPAQAATMIRLGADGVITGSRIVQIIAEAPADEMPAAVEAFVRDMVNAI